MDEAEHAMSYQQARRLRAALGAAGITRGQLWLHYFGLGGNVGEFEVDAYLHHSMMLSRLDRDLLAQGANEIFDDISRLRAPYASDVRDELRASCERTEKQNKNLSTQDSDVVDHDEPEEPEG